MSGEIVVIPFPHPGHIFPATELCRRLADRNRHVTIFLPSTSPPSSLHPLIRTVYFPLPHPTRFPPRHLAETLPDLIAEHFGGGAAAAVACAVVDEMASWLFAEFARFGIPSVGFFTSSAVSAAVEHATDGTDVPVGQALALPGMPDDFRISASDIPRRPPGVGGNGDEQRRHGGHPPRGLDGATGAVALLVNTCVELEGPFLEYLSREAGKPVWGVGPLLPDGFWAAPVRDEKEVRSRRECSISEPDLLRWLDSKPPGSVVYVSFGSLVGPTSDELEELADGLRDSGRPFVWVVQPETTVGPGPVRQVSRLGPSELANRAGGKGIILEGWAPQLVILSHVATGGFVCHCGWNSTVEALACGVPMLTWPVRGDQFLNASLVTGRLAAGCDVRGGGGGGTAVSKVDVARGIERMMTDEGIKRGAAVARAVFAGGYPRSSAEAVDAFLDFVVGGGTKN